MNTFAAALWAESLKARRSKVPALTTLGFCLAPLVSGLFMIILKDPEQARRMGLLGAKAQLAAGTAAWPTFFGLLTQATAVGGALLFAMVTSWAFGREFTDRTAKDLLALPTPRAAIVTAKLVVVAGWGLAATGLIFGIGLGVGAAVDIPGWSYQLAGRAGGDILAIAALDLALMTPIACLASAGRGYLAPLGWAFLTLALAQIAAVLGWGDWFPWSVPALYSGLAGPRAEQIGLHSHILVGLTCLAGLAALYFWWLHADQTR
jgi:ABC-2 type transport system permease protein